MRKCFVLAMLACSGCAPSGAANVEKEYTKHESVIIPENYEMVYRKVARKIPQCYNDPMHSVTAHAQLYPETRMGEITIGNSFGTFILFQVYAVDSENARMELYSGISTWENHFDIIKHWIDGTLEACH